MSVATPRGAGAGAAAAQPAAASANATARTVRIENPPFLFHFHKLDGFAALPFDHKGARVAKPVRLLQKAHAFGSELCGPDIEVRHADRDMIHETPARGRER